MKRKKKTLEGLLNFVEKEVDEIFAPRNERGFASRHHFRKGEIAARLNTIKWFTQRDKPISVSLTMPVQKVSCWPEALKACKSAAWEKAKNEAWNQLMMWLSQHDPDGDQKWNELRDIHDRDIVDPLFESKIVPFQKSLGLDDAFADSVREDIQLMLMEDAYNGNGHHCFFFHELLLVYKDGHFPCGWKGKWPQGSLIVY